MYWKVAVPRSRLLPDLVDIEMLRPVEWPNEASKFDVSILNSSMVSGLGMIETRRSVPLVDAPSIDHSLPPTPPGALYCDPPPTCPCTRNWVVPGTCTPGANRLSIVMLLPSTGRSITSRLVIALPVLTVLVSSNGAWLVTVTDSVALPSSSWKSICRRSRIASVRPERTDCLKSVISAVTL